ncbi:hypothetical protein [Haloferula rosea]|uniref:Uncharacterized protein n=1 Tax=Haloferula rosea TaxID=490093 RepID=A0A934R9S7_9BACT|nr:hypothetical protein [Haloferula rosea]MBK1826643.1 hypothetical protein [Haloferula rosea]
MKPFVISTLLGAALLLPSHATTVLEGSWTGSNQDVPANYGSNVAAAVPGISVAAGASGVVGTPDVAVTWSPLGDSGWQTYTSWNGRGDVFQLNGTAASIEFAPKTGTFVEVTSVDLDEWAGGGGVVVDWQLEGPTSGILASGTWTGNTAGIRETVAINETGAVDEVLTLSLTQTGGLQDYLAIDNVTFDQGPRVPEIVSFASDLQYIDGTDLTLSWEIAQSSPTLTVSLDDGSGAVDVTGSTDLGTGLGSIVLSGVTQSTVFTLQLSTGLEQELALLTGESLSLTSDSDLVVGPDFMVTLQWEVSPPGATVTLSDGTGSVDVTSDTDPLTGLGSTSVMVPAPVTDFSIEANASGQSVTKRVLRAAENTAAFSIDSASVVGGQTLTVSWTGAAAGPTDWIGVYRMEDSPGTDFSTQWRYLNGTQSAGAGPVDGSVEFTLPLGDYYVVHMLNDGYEIVGGPLTFSVVEPVEEVIKVVSVVRGNDPVDGEILTLEWESKAGMEYDIYASDTLEGDPVFDWEIVQIALASDGDGTTTFTEDLPEPTPVRRFYRVYEIEAPAP